MKARRYYSIEPTRRTISAIMRAMDKLQYGGELTERDCVALIAAQLGIEEQRRGRVSRQRRNRRNG